MDIVNLFGSVLERSIVVSGGILREEYEQAEIDVAAFSVAVRPVFQKFSDSVMDEWAKASQAIVSDRALRGFVEAQVIDLARKSVDAYLAEKGMLSIDGGSLA